MNIKKIDKAELLSKGLAFAVLLVLVILFGITTGGKFIQPGNIVTIIGQVVPYALLGFGLTLILITGGIDLSVGSILGFGGIVCAKLITMGFSIPVAIIISLILGAFVGFINGFCVTKLGIVPFIVTLGTQFAFRGLTQLVGDGKPVSIRALGDDRLTDAFEFIGNGYAPIVITVITAVVLGIILSKTGYGRRLYAVGSNEEAARLSGINVNKTKVIAYTLSGLTSAIAGVLLAAKMVSAQSNAGMGYELEGIAAAVLGGTSVHGGVRTII